MNIVIETDQERCYAAITSFSSGFQCLFSCHSSVYFSVIPDWDDIKGATA
ncbi:hypothetical protein [Wolbachia endosymbiont of Bemisia tabaci]|nr:hypothetical protein [Wolbachia endosymbiont of Bemisia tabaci]